MPRSVFDRYNIVNERDLRQSVSRLAGLAEGGQQKDSSPKVEILRVG
jgi:hypothetical protein